MKSIYIITFFLTAAIPSCAQNPQSKSSTSDELSSVIARFERALDSGITANKAGSISAAIIKGDSIIWSKAFGKANEQSAKRADTNTVYRIGSISKTFTGYLMMLLVQQGKIKLDEPVVKYVPELAALNKPGKPHGNSITFRQLASHTAGLGREPENVASFASGPIEEWETKVIQSIPRTDIIGENGKSYSYSNIGYGILGLALSRAAGKPFIELMQEQVFATHQMQNSFFVVDDKFRGRIAAGNHWNERTNSYSADQAKREFAGRGYKVPNGGIFTTANDLARFAIGLTSEKDVLSKAWRDTMQSKQFVTSKEASRGYGFGISVTDKTPEDKTLMHDGAVTGFVSYMILNPATRTGVIVLTNCDNIFPLINAEGDKLLENLKKAVR